MADGTRDLRGQNIGWLQGKTLDEAMEYFADKVKQNDFPSDGLVATV